MSKLKILSIVLFVFLIARLGLLLTSIDNITTTEEFYQGVIAKDIMGGTALPLLEYPANTYHGGILVTGLLTIPFFALFGPNLFALKLTPLLFSAVTLIIIFLFTWKFFNRRTTIITSVLYIFSPGIWTIFNLYSMGSHSENIVFTVLAMYIFYEIIFKGKRNPIYYLSLGITSGFGTFFAHTFLVTQAAMLLVWFIHDRNLLKKKAFYIFLIGFLLGMIPWIRYNLESQFIGIGELIRGFLVGKSKIDPTRLDVIFCLLMFHLSRITWFPQLLTLGGLEHSSLSGLSGIVYNLIYWFSFLYILWYLKRSAVNIIYSKEFLVLIFPVALFISTTCYATYFGGSNCFMDWRYVSGVFPFIFLTIAITLDKLFSRICVLKSVFISIFFASIILGIINYLNKFNIKDFGSGFKQAGYTYTMLLGSFTSKYPRNFYKILDNVTKLSLPQRYEVLGQVWSINLLGSPYPSIDFKEYIKLSYRLDEKYRPFFYKIVIKELYCTSDLSTEDLVHKIEILSQCVDDKYKPYFYEGLGAIMVKRYPEDSVRYKEGLLVLEEKYRPYYCRGLGEAIPFDVIEEYQKRFNNCMGWLKEEYKPLYLEGVGESLAVIGISYIIDKVSPNDIEMKAFNSFFNNLDLKYRKYVLKGMGQNLSYFYCFNSRKEMRQLIEDFKEEDKEIILKAIGAASIN